MRAAPIPAVLVSLTLLCGSGASAGTGSRDADRLEAAARLLGEGSLAAAEQALRSLEASSEVGDDATLLVQLARRRQERPGESWVRSLRAVLRRADEWPALSLPDPEGRRARFLDPAFASLRGKPGALLVLARTKPHVASYADQALRAAREQAAGDEILVLALAGLIVAESFGKAPDGARDAEALARSRLRARYPGTPVLVALELFEGDPLGPETPGHLGALSAASEAARLDLHRLYALLLARYERIGAGGAELRAMDAAIWAWTTLNARKISDRLREARLAGDASPAAARELAPLVRAFSMQTDLTSALEGLRIHQEIGLVMDDADRAAEAGEEARKLAALGDGLEPILVAIQWPVPPLRRELIEHLMADEIGLLGSLGHPGPKAPGVPSSRSP